MRRAMRLEACVVVVMVLGLAPGCFDDDGGSPPPPDSAPSDPGPAPVSCELVVDGLDDCPSYEELCRPDICGGHDCCFVEGGEWRTLVTDCFDGCPR